MEDPIDLHVEDDDVLEIQLEDGLVELLTVAQARERAGQSRAIGDDLFVLPSQIGLGAHRSVQSAGIAGVRQYDLSDLFFRAKSYLVDAGAAGLSAELLAYVVEKEFWNQCGSRLAGLGLKRLVGGFDRFELENADDLGPASAAGAPYLLLLHGTFSNASAAFSDLVGSEEWKSLYRHYDGRVLAFEHKTLGLSPADNAVALARSLPRGARLHLITHSRGGLIGDLMSLVADPDDKNLAASLEAIKAARGAASPARDFFSLLKDPPEEAARTEIETLRALHRILKERQLSVERFVRVASPAAGTVLASRRLDSILKLMLNVVTLIPALTFNPMFGFVKALALATVDKRSDPRVLPGLEAMMPESPFIHFLNTRDAVPTSAPLAVVAGDIQGSGVWGRMKVLATDFLFGTAEHDLVVDADSMYRGLRREGALVSYQQGPEISHTAYFKNRTTRARIRNYLLHGDFARESPRGFVKLPWHERPLKADNQVTRSASELPIVIFIGAQFAVTDPHGHAPDRLLAGTAGAGFGLLSASGEWVVDELFYGDLLSYLRSHFRVETMAFDHRRAPEELAKELARRIERSEGEVSLLAHSAGGLVVAAYLAAVDANPSPVDAHAPRQAQLREVSDLSAHPSAADEADSAAVASHGAAAEAGGPADQGADAKPKAGRVRVKQVVLLGAPLFGSFEALRWQVGDGPLMQQLGLLDPVGRGGHVAYMRQQPGLFALLPSSLDAVPVAMGPLAFLQELLPTGKHHEPLRRLREPIDRAIEHGCLSGVHWVLGACDREHTVCGLVPVDRLESEDSGEMGGESSTGKGLAWARRSGGDGFMLRPLKGQPLGGATTWLADADHIGMATDPSQFAAIKELLSEGRTSRWSWGTLSEGDTGALSPVASHPQLFPGRMSLITAALGGRMAPRPSEDALTLEIEVLHGSLEYLRGPVAVGHCAGAPIRGAEGVLDQALGGALSARQYFGFYPEQLGDVELVRASAAHAPDALVLGLGPAGELSADGLANAMQRGALRYALAERESARNGSADREALQELTLHTVLMGTFGRQGLTVTSALAALVRGVLEANRTLQERETRLDDLDDGQGRVRITRLLVIERYEDVAEEAQLALNRLESLISAALDSRFQIAARRHPQERAGRQPGRPPQAYQQGAWHPLFIEGSPTEDHDSEFKFTFLGSRAAVGAYDGLRATQQIRSMIEVAITQDTFGQTNNTIYELLMPREIKDDVAAMDNLTLVVDEDSSTIPWELMATRDRQGRLRPLATRMGVLRRLKLSDCTRPLARSPGKQVAVVIGDPSGGPAYPRLPGAREEARAVQRALVGNGYQVESLIASNDADELPWQVILNTVVGSGCRILHIAGHGFYDPQHPHQQGVVIGPGQFLTPATIRQLPVVPELVFLNCCHLGAITPRDAALISGKKPLESEIRAAEDSRRRVNRLAASMAVELMRLGVRAVVTAGWAVEDQAASAFARTFYGAMLMGDGFGEAVKAARGAALKQSPDSSTWGAYQCYGEPAFRLQPDRVSKQRQISTRSALVRELRAIDEQLVGRGGRDGVAQICQQLEDLWKEVPEEWHAHADARFELGNVFANAGHYRAAIEHYKVALEADEASWPAAMVEQLANMLVRRAAELGHGQPFYEPLPEEDPKRMFETAHVLMDGLLALRRTPERLALRGSYYKKRATLEMGEQRRALLDAATAAYGEACGSGKVYHVANYLQLRALQSGAFSPEEEDLFKVLQASKTSMSEQDFWGQTALGDVELAGALRLTDEAALEAAYGRVIQAYRTAFHWPHRPREHNSVMEHLQDLQRICEGDNGAMQGRPKHVAQLERAIRALSAEEYPAEPIAVLAG